MNIQTVITNLRRTIAGKEMLLATYENPLVGRHDVGSRMAMTATVEFLKVNIDELRRILQDVESCVEKDAEQSWRDNPDRMGGQFTQDEIDNSEKW